MINSTMSRHFIIYTQKNCPNCIAVKKKIEKLNYTYTEMLIGSDISREDFVKKYPTIKSAPYIIEEPNSNSVHFEGNLLTFVLEVEKGIAPPRPGKSKFIKYPYSEMRKN